MIGFGVWLVGYYAAFVKEKGLNEEFSVWCDCRHEKEMKKQKFIESKGLDSAFWNWREKLWQDHKLGKRMDDSRQAFLEMKGLWEEYVASGA